MSLSAAKITEQKIIGPLQAYPVKTATTIHQGGTVALDSTGYLVPAGDTAGHRVVGVAQESVINSGSSGDKKCLVARGSFKLALGADHGLTQADVGKAAFVEDDAAVTGAANTDHQIIAGEILELVGSTHAWVGMIEPLALDQGAVGEQSLVGPGAVDVVSPVTLLTCDGTDALTLADGTRIGQEKYIRLIAGTNSPEGVLTPANLAEFTTITFDAVNEWALLRWNGTEWRILAIGGATPA